MRFWAISYLSLAILVTNTAKSSAQDCAIQQIHYPTSKFFTEVFEMIPFDIDANGPRSKELCFVGQLGILGFDQEVDYFDSLRPQGIASWFRGQWSIPASSPVDWGFSYGICAVEFDEDGAGPMQSCLVMGGDLNTIGNQSVNKIARWNGNTWSPLGNGFNGFVAALAVYDEDGEGPGLPQLFATGNFTASGSTTLKGIARWNGLMWEPLGLGLLRGITPTDQQAGTGKSLAIHDPDGSGPIRPRLVVGGEFGRCGSTSARNISAWDGVQWSAFGAGCGTSSPTSYVNTLLSADLDGNGPQPTTLVAAGLFTVAGGISVNGIAAWNGVSWSALGTGLNGFPRKLLVYEQGEPLGVQRSVLAIGGGLSIPGLSSSTGFALWNGVSWANLGNERCSGFGAACYFDDDDLGPNPPRLYSTIADPNSSSHVYLKYWDGQRWRIPDKAVKNVLGHFPINAIHEFRIGSEANPNGTSLIVAGEFDTVGDVQTDSVAAFHNGEWTALAQGTTNWRISTLGDFDLDGSGPGGRKLLAAGQFTQIGGTSARVLAYRDDSSWYQFPGVDVVTFQGDRLINSICEFDEDGPQGPKAPALFVGGAFILASGASNTNGIAKWDGAAWQPVGGGISQTGVSTPTVYAMCVFDDDGSGPHLPALYVAGRFDFAGNVNAKHIAKWDGSTWTALRGGLQDYATCLCTFDTDREGPNPPELYVGGRFHQAGQVPTVGASKVARWNGLRWAGLGAGLNVYPSAMSLFDPDGRGPQPLALYVGGEFTTAGSLTAPGLARWDGQSWQGLDGGVQSYHTGIKAMRSYLSNGSPSLFFGGDFILIDGNTSCGFAELRGCRQSITSPSALAIEP